jgi:hypothetical protein
LKFTNHKGITVAALLLTFAVAQLGVAAGFAESSVASSVSATVPQLLGVLTTRDNKPILVNGANAVTGATIPSPASVETPDGVGATIRVGALGSICIAPNSKVTVEFDRQGNVGTVKVTITEGCVILNTLKDTTGFVITPQGTAGQTGPATSGSIDVCSRPGAAAVVNQGAAADAGAGASALDCGAAAGAAAIPPAGIPLPVTAAITAGGGTALWLLFRGGNPSPSQ